VGSRGKGEHNHHPWKRKDSLASGHPRPCKEKKGGTIRTVEGIRSKKRGERRRHIITKTVQRSIRALRRDRTFKRDDAQKGVGEQGPIRQPGRGEGASISHRMDWGGAAASGKGELCYSVGGRRK